MTTPKVKIGFAYIPKFKNYVTSSDALLLQKALLPKAIGSIGVINFWLAPMIMAIGVVFIAFNFVR